MSDERTPLISSGREQPPPAYQSVTDPQPQTYTTQSINRDPSLSAHHSATPSTSSSTSNMTSNGGAKVDGMNGHTNVAMEDDRYNGSTVSFHNLYYDVLVKAGFCKTAPQTIIKDCSGIFKPGTMNAIMGPTGSGKSSLLDILAARKEPRGLSGHVLINGHPQPPNFRLMSGYVVQDDVVMGTLSVSENLRFSADLRLPKSYSSKDKKRATDRVVTELGLELCADTRCGDDFTRGVSGGERKRCNVGMELITAPGVLFLDEPTTGLDASTANKVMLLLKDLARKGSTIIFSIHQPRYSIFKLLDTVCLLGNGETIYNGPANEALNFFSSLGYEIEEHDNPADFFLDVILGNVESSIPAQPEPGVEHEPETKVEPYVTPVNSDNAQRLLNISSNLAKAFRESEWYSRLGAELDPLVQRFEASGEHSASVEAFEELQYHTSPCKQFGVVCGRTLKNLVRNPRTSFLQIVTMCFFALITGAIYFQTPKDCQSGVQNRVGAFFFMIMNMVFGNLSAIDLFINERKIFIHENISGFYRVSSYFFAKLFCDVIPNRSIPIICFCIIVYWMIGLFAAVDTFFLFILTLVMTSLAGSSIAFVASATTRTAAIANLICALLYVFQMIFSGLLVNLDSLGDWIKWAKYISIFSYAMQALQVNEFQNVDFYVDTEIPGTNTTQLVNCVKGNKNAWLEKQGIAYGTPWDFWVNIVALAAITIGLLVITYIQLRRIKKLK